MICYVAQLSTLDGLRADQREVFVEGEDALKAKTFKIAGQPAKLISYLRKIY